jgi:hypothetical protein
MVGRPTRRLATSKKYWTVAGVSRESTDRSRLLDPLVANDLGLSQADDNRVDSARRRAKEERMYARVVRFTDVDPDHLAQRLGEAEREGPPVDIPAKSVQILHDADQGTAVVIQVFETADDMEAPRPPSVRWTQRTRPGRAFQSTAARSRPS